MARHDVGRDVQTAFYDFFFFNDESTRITLESMSPMVLGVVTEGSSVCIGLVMLVTRACALARAPSLACPRSLPDALWACGAYCMARADA